MEFIQCCLKKLPRWQFTEKLSTDQKPPSPRLSTGRTKNELKFEVPVIGYANQ